MSRGMFEAREHGGSPRADSKCRGADSEMNGANKIGCGELRTEATEMTRGWGRSAGYGRIRGGIRGWRSKG